MLKAYRTNATTEKKGYLEGELPKDDFQLIVPSYINFKELYLAMGRGYTKIRKVIFLDTGTIGEWFNEFLEGVERNFGTVESLMVGTDLIYGLGEVLERMESVFVCEGELSVPLFMASLIFKGTALIKLDRYTTFLSYPIWELKETDLAILMVLERSDEPMPASEIAKRINVKRKSRKKSNESDLDRSKVQNVLYYLEKHLIKEGLVEKVKLEGKRGGHYRVTMKGKEVAKLAPVLLRVRGKDVGDLLQVIE